MSASVNGGSARPVAEQSTAELVQHASQQISQLIRDELALARLELAEKGKHAGLGVGMLSGGGVIAIYGLGAAITAAVLGLAVVLPAWAAALIVAGVLLIIAGVLALVGRTQVRRAVPPVPRDAVRSVRADVDTVTAAARKGRS
jgi:hypothetical protein